MSSLQNELRQKQAIIENQEKITTSFAVRFNELNHDSEDIENDQLSKRKLARLRRDADTNNEGPQVVSCAMNGLKISSENLKKRLLTIGISSSNKLAPPMMSP